MGKTKESFLIPVCILLHVISFIIAGHFQIKLSRIEGLSGSKDEDAFNVKLVSVNPIKRGLITDRFPLVTVT